MSEIFDLVVLGGGISGVGVARLAARNGLRVAVIERSDLASGASSASSHMLHGGLRYLEHGRLHLVREALIERAALSRMAPALARPRRFLVPVYRGDRIAPWKLQIGLTLYDFLAGRRGFSPHVMTRAREARELEPELSNDALRGAGIYSDVVMDDARLAVAVARDAAAHGAEILTWHEAVSARPLDDGTLSIAVRDRLESGERTLVTRMIVNATGAWCDATRRWLAAALTPGASAPTPLLRPSRGVHLYYPALTRGHGLLLSAQADGRVFFVVPFGEWSLVGTTEVEVASPPPAEAFAPTLEEVRYLRAELARALPACADIHPITAVAGLRPLLASTDDVGQASREHRVVTEGAVISLAGGKYTTFRVMARDALAAVAERLGRREPIVDSDAALPPPLSGSPSSERSSEHALDHEFARRLEDVMRRRTHLWLGLDGGHAASRVVAPQMAARLGWDTGRLRDELANWDAQRHDGEALIEHAREAG
jgi:glycerol-3-phosphate dehydrogenase